LIKACEAVRVIKAGFAQIHAFIASIGSRISKVFITTEAYITLNCGIPCLSEASEAVATCVFTRRTLIGAFITRTVSGILKVFIITQTSRIG
jgi:hypothetical protein